MTKKISYCQLYHNLRKGPIYDALSDYAKAALEVDSIKKILFFVKVSDKMENDEFIENINIIKKNRMKLVNMKEVDFDDTKYRNKRKFETAADTIAKRIIKILEAELAKRELVILHTHNLNLGSNPILASAIGKIADWAEARKKPLAVIYHVHDLVENVNPERIEFLKTVAGKKVEKNYISSILYPNSKNLYYAVANSTQAKLLKDIGVDRSMVLADSINVKLFSKKPIYKLNNFNLNKLRIEKIDFKEDILHKLEKYALHKNYEFDRNRKIILAPVTICKKKNIWEALLLLKILNHIKDEWQLLVTNNAMRDADREYEIPIIEYIKRNKLPCTVGFGPEIISSKNDRNVIDGIVFQYTYTDLFGISKAVMTNSVKEETDNIYLEGWLSGTKVFGRKIGDSIQDLERNGMNFKHLYDNILIRTDMIKNFKQRIVKVWGDKINTIRKERKLKALNEAQLRKELAKSKIITRGKMEFIDFCEISPEMQKEVIETIDPEELLMLNPKLRKIVSFIDKKNIKIININRKTIIKSYSVKTKKEDLKKILKESAKIAKPGRVKIAKVKSNDMIYEHFMDVKNMRLLS